MRILILFLFSITFTPAVVFWTDSDVADGEKLAATPLFSPVGTVLVQNSQSLCAGTGTLLSPQWVLTVKHNLRAADGMDDPRGAIVLVQPNYVTFRWHNQQLPIQAVIPFVGKDLVLLQLQNPITDSNVTYPVLGAVEPGKLAQLIWDSLPGLGPDLMPSKEHMKRIFCMAGTGRSGLVSQPKDALLRAANRDFSVLAGYVPSLSRGAARFQEGAQQGDDMFSVALSSGQDVYISERPLACGTCGDSGAPIFMCYKAGKNPNQWRLIGLYTNGDQTESGYMGQVQIFGDTPQMKIFFNIAK